MKFISWRIIKSGEAYGLALLLERNMQRTETRHRFTIGSLIPMVLERISENRSAVTF